MMSKADAVRMAGKLYGREAFLLIRQTLEANWRKAVGIKLPDGTQVELGRGRNWEAAFESAAQEISKAKELAQQQGKPDPYADAL
jgi:hypothetical protein